MLWELFLTSTIGALVIRVHEQLQLVDLSAESQLASEHVVKYGMVKIPAKAMVL